MGLVEDTRGVPVAGAVISLFGRGLRGSSLVTLSDDTGRFFLPSLPAGSYTLRAMGDGHHPAPAHKITVVPDRDAVYTVSLAPLGEAPAEGQVTAATEDSDRARELTWLFRHKRRSVLEDTASGAAASTSWAPASFSPTVPDLAGSVELVATPTSLGLESLEPMAGLSLLRLEGRLTDSARWSLAGLVAETEGTAWRLGAEFVVEPGGGHEVRAGSGYGSRFLRSLDRSTPDRAEGRGVGALFLEDRWEMDERIVASFGARLAHIGFLAQANHVDPALSLEIRRDARTRIRGGVSARTLAPGGDLLAVSTLASAPAIAFAVMDQDLQAERSYLAEMTIEQDFGPAKVGAHVFYEDVRSQLYNAFEGPSRSLRVINAGDMASRGIGLTVARRFGSRVSGSFTYTLGHSWRTSAMRWDVEGGPPAALGETDYHDLVARLETQVPGTATRLSALYRVNRMDPTAQDQEPSLHSRFDVQLSQALPFIRSWTRADWDFLLAVRNLYYEPSEGATLDELAVSNPPKRLLGGIAVRF